jgi:GNAT superfamily N-acetyltransferase
MSIIKASQEDLIEVLYLLRVCIQEMNARGWFHLDMHNIMVRDNINNNMVFLYKENEVYPGMITLNVQEEPEYKHVQSNDPLHKPLIAHRLIVHPSWRKKGIAKKLLAFSEQYAKDNGFTSLRLGVFSENLDAVSLYKKLNYNNLGEIFLQYQKIPYYCYEKII